MALPFYTDKNWKLSEATIVYERKPLSQEIVNAYYDEFRTLTGASDTKTDAFIADPLDSDLQNGKKQFIDPYSLVRANINYVAVKDVASFSVTDQTIAYFAALTGLTNSAKLFFTTTDFIPQITEILINGVRVTPQGNKLTRIQIEFTEFGTWVVKETTP